MLKKGYITIQADFLKQIYKRKGATICITEKDVWLFFGELCGHAIHIDRQYGFFIDMEYLKMCGSAVNILNNDENIQYFLTDSDGERVTFSEEIITPAGTRLARGHYGDGKEIYINPTFLAMYKDYYCTIGKDSKFVIIWDAHQKTIDGIILPVRYTA